MLQNQAGHAPEPQRRRCADCNARILRTVDDYTNRKLWTIYDILLITFPYKIFIETTTQGCFGKKVF